MKKQDLQKNIDGIAHYSLDQFEQDVQTYVNAIRQRRMLCKIHSVSSSGMSRTLSFHSCEIGQNGNGWYRQYYCLFIALGFSRVKNEQYFRINGCGMDMVFHTNYSIIRMLWRLGYIEQSEVENLAQMTPVVL